MRVLVRTLQFLLIVPLFILWCPFAAGEAFLGLLMDIVQHPTTYRNGPTYAIPMQNVLPRKRKKPFRQFR